MKIGPNGVLNVKSLEFSSSTSICRYAFEASGFVKNWALLVEERISSVVGRWK